MKPTTTDVNSALNAIEAAERDPLHPRSLARKAINRWRSDAQRLKLGVSNQADSGAPSLRVDTVLGHDHHTRRLGKR